MVDIFTPGCCDSLNVVSNRHNMNGTYTRREEDYNGRPVYQRDNGRCVYYGAHWKVDNCELNDDTQVYCILFIVHLLIDNLYTLPGLGSEQHHQ